MKVSSASTIPLKPGACRSQGHAETDDASGRPSSDRSRRAPRSSPGFCPRSSPGRDQAIFPSSQMRHWRLGQRIEDPSAALAAKPQKPMQAEPADDLAARAMGTALSRDALDAGRSQRVLLAAAFAALLHRTSRRAPNHARLLKRRHRLPPLALAHPPNRRQPSRKILSLDKIAPSIRPILNKSTANAIRADNFLQKTRNIVKLAPMSNSSLPHALLVGLTVSTAVSRDDKKRERIFPRVIPA